jgi:hypothetical protein
LSPRHQLRYLIHQAERHHSLSCNVIKVPGIGHLLAGPALNHGWYVLGLSNRNSSASSSIQDVKEPSCLLVSEGRHSGWKFLHIICDKTDMNFDGDKSHDNGTMASATGVPCMAPGLCPKAQNRWRGAAAKRWQVSRLPQCFG